MKYLPSEQQERIQEAIETFNEQSALVMTDCNCDRPWVGDHGKKEIHKIVSLRRDSGQVFVNEGTCSVYSRKNWKVCDPEAVVKQNVDLL